MEKVEYGSIIFASNVADMYEALRHKYVVVAMVEDLDMASIEGVYSLADLLPPAASIAAETEGNVEMARAIYQEYLLSNNALRSMAAILTALSAGTNVMVFVPHEESMNFTFVETFAGVFANLFGIHIGNTVSDSTMNAGPAQLVNIADLCFVFGFWPFELYCLMMPYGYPPGEQAVTKIVQGYHYQFADLQQATQWVVGLIAHNKDIIERNNQLPAGATPKQSVMFLNDEAAKLAMERKK
jgi:hypothetical protein